jgi:hypothetical protein
LSACCCVACPRENAGVASWAHPANAKGIKSVASFMAQVPDKRELNASQPVIDITGRGY